MKIFFIGTVAFSKSMLEKLIELKADVVGVATLKSSEFNSDYADLTPICLEKNIPVRYETKLNSPDIINWIADLKPDIIFCFGWSSLLKKEILQSVRLGVVGYHPAMLPANRGRHPLIWALALGLEKTGSTFFFMDEGADSGDILSQKEILIDENDDAQLLYSKIIFSAKNQLTEFLPQLQQEIFSVTKQENEKANYWRKRTKRDGKIDWRMSSRSIYNLVRALAKPYAGAHVEWKENEFKIWKVREAQYHYRNIESGKVLGIFENKITVKTADGAIEILEHELPAEIKIGDYL